MFRFCGTVMVWMVAAMFLNCTEESVPAKGSNVVDRVSHSSEKEGARSSQEYIATGPSSDMMKSYSAARTDFMIYWENNDCPGMDKYLVEIHGSGPGMSVEFFQMKVKGCGAEYVFDNIGSEEFSVTYSK